MKRGGGRGLVDIVKGREPTNERTHGDITLEGKFVPKGVGLCTRESMGVG